MSIEKRLNFIQSTFSKDGIDNNYLFRKKGVIERKVKDDKVVLDSVYFGSNNKYEFNQEFIEVYIKNPDILKSINDKFETMYGGVTKLDKDIRIIQISSKTKFVYSQLTDLTERINAYNNLDENNENIFSKIARVGDDRSHSCNVISDFRDFAEFGLEIFADFYVNNNNKIFGDILTRKAFPISLQNNLSYRYTYTIEDDKLTICAEPNKNGIDTYPNRIIAYIEIIKSILSAIDIKSISIEENLILVNEIDIMRNKENKISNIICYSIDTDGAKAILDEYIFLENKDFSNIISYTYREDNDENDFIDDIIALSMI